MNTTKPPLRVKKKPESIIFQLIHLCARTIGYLTGVAERLDDSAAKMEAKMLSAKLDEIVKGTE